jgi:cellulose synthase/poly-beta-1,6-N-acetylglucosamine synthase-like glycosyltransferase
MAALAWGVAGVLACFALWRLWLLAGAFRSKPAAPEPLRGEEAPRVVILAPMRNEAERADILLEALERLEYPRDRLRIMLGDDASTDGTAARLAAWAGGRPEAALCASAQKRGKAAMMNRLLAAEPGPPAPFIAVYDAKHAPEPESLGILAAVLRDAQTGAAAGYLEPRNARAGLAARYAALEFWVTQLIGNEGRERRGLSSSAKGGNVLYRRAALEQAGGFRAGALSEDTEIHLALTRAGWRTRFVREARAGVVAPETAAAFWNQRLRWSKGLYDAPRHARHAGAWAAAAGYADRLALLAAAGFAAAGDLPWWVPAGYALPPALMCAAAMSRAGAWRDAPGILLAVCVMLPLDVAVSVWGALMAAAGRPPAWRDENGAA